MGYRRIDGIEPSAGMLEDAKKKQVYDRLVQEFVGKNKLDFENGKL